ncbi:MAG: hypothetical protein JRG91_14110 [Deltaproteobacteria bacterium]|nr:hypothetical protein [Deltaproteobacteria bacterium]
MRPAIHATPGMPELCDAKSRIEGSAAGDGSVSSVEVSGQRERHIIVDFDAERLSQFEIAMADAAKALVSFLGLDAEMVETSGTEVTIAIDECEEVPFELDEVMSIRLKDPSGNEVPLAALADVRIGIDGETFEHEGGRAMEVVVHPASPTTPEAMGQLVRGWLEGTEARVEVLD